MVPGTVEGKTVMQKVNLCRSPEGCPHPRLRAVTTTVKLTSTKTHVLRAVFDQRYMTKENWQLVEKNGRVAIHNWAKRYLEQTNTIQDAWSVRQENRQGITIYTGLLRVLSNGLIDLLHNSGMEGLFVEFLRYEDNLPRLRTEWVPKESDENEQQYLEKWTRKEPYGLVAGAKQLGRRICDDGLGARKSGTWR